MQRIYWLTGASLLVCATALGSPALAQRAPTQGVTVGEVVVTAERRAQSIQKSSLAISVLSPDAIKQAGVTQARDLNKLDPGLIIGQGGPATQIYVRGVGDFGSTPVTNPAVATNVDGIYVARSQSIEGNFFDLERIEVLKGPQGTLYGRNSSGGVLNIISRKPALGQFGGDVSVELGDYSLVRTEGAVNVPIGDSLALRAAFQAVSRNGFSTQGFDDDHHQSYRLSALWKPTDTFSLHMTGDYEHVGGNGPAYVAKPPVSPGYQTGFFALGAHYPTDPRANYFDADYQQAWQALIVTALPACVNNSAFALARSANGPVTTNIGLSYQSYCPSGSSFVYPTTKTTGPFQDNKFTNFSAEASWDLGFATLTVLPGYRKVRNNYVTFPSGPYVDSDLGPEKSDMRSLETRLGNTTHKLTWVLGLYLFDEQQNASSGGVKGFSLRNGNTDLWNRLRNQSEAVFGQTTYSLTDNLRLITGLRYTRDHRLIVGNQLTHAYLGGDPWLPPGTGPSAGACYLKPDPCVRDSFQGKKTYTATTGKVGVEYDLTSRNMLFLTYGTGEKAGGFNASSQLGVPGNNAALAYGPEKLKAFEAGSRNRFFDGALQANVEVFHWKYDNAQEVYSYLNASGNPAFGYTNAGKATMYGGELDVTWRATMADTVHVGVEYVHSNFDKFLYANIGANVNTTACRIIPAVAGSVFQTIDCSGRPLTRTPKWGGTANYVHTFDLPNGGRLDASLSAQFATKRWGTIDYLPQMQMPGYVTEDISITYHHPENKWAVSAYVRNLTDRLVYTGTYSSTGMPSWVVANLGPPRTFGVRIDSHF